MRRSPEALAAAFYRQVASAMARILSSSRIVESVLVHRSVATGEVRLGRSDIDLLIVIDQADSEDGGKLASLYEKVRRWRRVNPALGHIEVHDPAGLGNWLETDTYWGSLERRSATLLRGRPVVMRPVPLDVDHAVGNFAIWVEGFFSVALQQRSRRNLRKTVLEVWNAYATATGLIAQPYLRRDDTEAHWRAAEDGADVGRFASEPRLAAGHVFELAERLHARLLPPLAPLSRPIVFETRLPPRLRRRTFVVLPRPRDPLPPLAFSPGAFLCTPEALDLFLHYANAFLYWTLPPELLAIGLRPPAVAEFLRSCRYYAQTHFLRNPGFINQASFTPLAVAACLRHALPWLSSGDLPPPLPLRRVESVVASASSCPDYYRTAYAGVARENRELREALLTLSGACDV